jgi:hypothetical protein
MPPIVLAEMAGNRLDMAWTPTAQMDFSEQSAEPDGHGAL